MMKNKKGSNVVYVVKSPLEDRNVSVQLIYPEEDKLVAPFGLSIFDKESGGRLGLDISVDRADIVEWAQALDARNIQVAIQNKATWFKAGTTDDQIQSMYYPTLQQDPMGKYAPKLHTKVNSMPGNSQLQVRIFKKETNKWAPGTNDDLMRKFVKLIPIIEIGPIWFQKLQFGMTLLTKSVMVFPAEEQKEFNFLWGSLPPPSKEAPSLPSSPKQPPPVDEQAAAEVPPHDVNVSVLLEPPAKKQKK